MAKTTIKLTLNLQPLAGLARQSPSIFNRAMKKGAVQFLNWANLGSINSPKKPPIRFGVLRGSSSAFVGSELVKKFEQVIRSGGNEIPTPATSHTAPNTTITFAWNTDYAAKMHEWRGGWGPFTIQDGSAGNKWLEEHLQADADDLMEVIGKEYAKESGI